MPRERREYQADSFDALPLFQQENSPAQAEPLHSPANDPWTAAAAASDETVRRSVRKGTARCLLTLMDYPEGLTDNEAVDAYGRKYPDELAARGMVGFVRSVIRNWCLLKPNDDTRNHLEKNLCLIHRTGVTRPDRHSLRPNVAFHFIHTPTALQLAEWEQLANGREDDDDVEP